MFKIWDNIFNFEELIPIHYRLLKKNSLALAGVSQWIERGPAKQRVAGSIPSQGTCLGCGPGSQ